uniref:Secreted protein n=1 Tax=Pyxicephalus adspersus TaxID=30357 RepID=A0AAV2ZMW7_PYXAD|nr:TPA: hypothetical protein GDO54_015332 [Pyxicephalus adspersus]
MIVFVNCMTFTCLSYWKCEHESVTEYAPVYGKYSCKNLSHHRLKHFNLCYQFFFLCCATYYGSHVFKRCERKVSTFPTTACNNLRYIFFLHYNKRSLETGFYRDNRDTFNMYMQ